MAHGNFNKHNHRHIAQLKMADLDDIEDIISLGREETKYDNKVLPRSLRKRGCNEEPRCDSFIPGTHSVYVKTWGCTHNTSDGEYMAGLLASKGYTILGMLTNYKDFNNSILV